MSLYGTILNNLLNHALSLSDLHAQVTVSLPTLRKAIQELTDNRWIRVVGQAEANGGRPAMLYGLDDSYYLLVGVHLQLPGIRLTAADLSGGIVHVEDDFTNTVPHPDQVVTRIVDFLGTLRVYFPDRQVLGVGIASPGFTDPVTGDILSIGRVEGWRNFPLCQRLQNSLSLPVVIANDVDCMAFAEYQYTGTSFDQNLAYVGFEEGVKVSMFLNGQIYKGSFGNTGLIITRLLNLGDIDPEIDLQQALTIHGVNEMFSHALQTANGDTRRSYQPIADIPNPRQRFLAILESANAEMKVSQQVARTLNSALATAIANIVYIIQPDILTIGGLLSTLPAPLYADLEMAIRGHLSPLFANRLTIQPARLASPDRASLGASYHLLQTYLADATADTIRLI